MGKQAPTQKRKENRRKSPIKQFAVDQFNCLKGILIVNNGNETTKRCHYYTTSSNSIAFESRALAISGDSCLVTLEH